LSEQLLDLTEKELKKVQGLKSQNLALVKDPLNSVKQAAGELLYLLGDLN
jgi:hypothetical protein